MGFNSHSNLLRLIRDGGKWGDGYLCPNTYSLHCHHQSDCIKMGSCVSHLNVSFIVWAKSQVSVHKPQFLNIKKRAEADRIKVLLLNVQRRKTDFYQRFFVFVFFFPEAVVYSSTADKR